MSARGTWNTATSELSVLSLRTWREGVWWPHETEISETAVVATIPYAVRSADDYTTMRETMLLHDGIELPCIVETLYEIRQEPRGVAGDDGGWTFARHDPCVVSRFDLSVPIEAEAAFESVGGAPEPATGRTLEHGVGYTWTMEMLERLPRPLIADPASLAPHVLWSTWPGWHALGEALVEHMDDAAVLSEALRDSVRKLVRNDPDARSRAGSIADFVSETTRAVRYPDRFWAFSPRAAVRTWETAYGHRLDRAALAAALFREVGCDVVPVYTGAGLSERVPESVPSLTRFGGLSLWIEAEGLRALYDPASSRLTDGDRSLDARTVWRLTGPGWSPRGPMATGEAKQEAAEQA